MLNFFNKIIKDFFYLNSFIPLVFKNLFNNFIFSDNFKDINKISDDDKVHFSDYKFKNLKKSYFNSFFKHNSFLFADMIWIRFMSYNYSLKNVNNNIFRSYFRVISVKQGFYLNLKNLKNIKNFNYYLLNNFLIAYKFLWKGIKFWVLPLTICFSIIYFTLVLRSLPFNKVMFGWICILMFIYWLISGFVFFFKKYQFGKYTSSIQRFWRRTYILFWMIEGGTFLVFMFFTFNSSQESFYMYDQISILKTHLYSWKYFLLKLFPIIIILISTYLFMISIKWNIYSKNSIILLILTFFLSYLVWIEFYQFFHVVNFYGNLNWIYDIDDHSWSLELEPRRTRIVNHYVMLLFILKFWHIIFIYGFWIFFVIRCWETKRIRFPLLSANFQNFLILYIFAWVFMYPWIKFYFRKFLDIPYYWFYVNNRKIFIRIFFNDLKLIYYGILFSFENFKLNFLAKFNYYTFFYWNILNNSNNFESYRKHIIKDRILISLKLINS